MKILKTVNVAAFLEDLKLQHIIMTGKTAFVLPHSEKFSVKGNFVCCFSPYKTVTL